MLPEINLLMTWLKTKLPGGLLENGDWQKIISLYRRCGEPLQRVLSQELSTLINVNPELMRGLLASAKGADHTCPKLAEINQMMRQDRALFQSLAIKIVPGLPELSLSEAEWCQLMSLSRGGQPTRLTSLSIISSLTKIKKISYDDLLLSISKKPSFRSARPEFNSVTSLSVPFVKRRRLNSIEPNPSIVSCSLMTGSLQQDLVATGARVISSPKSVTPQKGFSAVHKTPGGTKVRRVFENNVGRVFLPLSPEQSAPSSSMGMVSTVAATGDHIHRLLPKLELSRPKSIAFTATLPKILAQQKVARRSSQNALMKASCRDVFMAHGIDTVITSRGSKYHWSHLIAHFLGGAQQRENLIPGTAASNFNTLELVEQFVAEKLIQGEALSMEIHVTPLFSHASLIPDELKFHLSWDEAGEHYTETIMINPRSYRRESAATLATVGLFRAGARSLSLSLDPALTNDSTP